MALLRAAILVAFFPVIAAAADAPATAPATKPAAVARKPNPFIQQQLQSCSQTKQQVRQIRLVATCKSSDLIRVTLENGSPRIEWIGATLRNEQVRFEIQDLKCTWLVQNFGQMNITAYRFDAGIDAPWMASFSADANNFFVNSQRLTDTELLQFMFNRNGANCTLAVNIHDGRQFRQKVQAQGRDLLTIRAAQAETCAQYLEPALAMLCDVEFLRPGPTDVYRAFEQIQPEPAVMQRYKAILPRLDADAFPDREAASADLVTMGPAGVLAAVRQDMTVVTPEQKNRLMAWIEKNTRRPAVTAASAQKDISFLIECLEDDDVAVRVVAKAALESATGQAFKFDTARNDQAYLAAVRQLRREQGKLKPVRNP